MAKLNAIESATIIFNYYSTYRKYIERNEGSGITQPFLVDDRYNTKIHILGGTILKTD